ncbi:helix-turn-helix domain-containing protein [Jatrophihabitans telluris]|uniref:helix-turn-helix domain-containing protein n=1 Tax=Jatrophihabitans telluris TaxID=2038343 RepID=UPI00322218EC
MRKHRGLTQEGVAAACGAHITVIRRYEADTSRPALDVLRNLGFTLNASADSLPHEPDDRRSETPSFRTSLEALDPLGCDGQADELALIEGAMLRHQVRQAASDRAHGRHRGPRCRRPRYP